jgi:dihydroorotate dehydrogenase electron transfer subunit
MEPELCARNELPKIFQVSRVVQEAKNIRSIFFKGKLECKPGQFIMVWLPGVEEKPMAISEVKKDDFAFAYHTVGKFTKALDTVKAGDKIGVRGPYGNSFSFVEPCVVVGGGVGMSSVSTLIDALKNPIIINGARDGNHVMYQNRFKGKKMIITTDDGSLGKKGFTTDALREVLKENPKIKRVYTCGPEVMMKKILETCTAYKVECEASLERYMKCGYGICGNCMVDDKILCIDGPIFNSKTLNSLKDFGNFARLKTGKKVALKEYYSFRS